MDRRPLEPGILPIFKLYIAMRLGVLLSSGVVYLLWNRFRVRLDIVPYAILFIVDMAFLFVFLGWTWLQRKLGRAHLPMALLTATAIPIVEAQYLTGLYGQESLPEFWLVFPFLLVPLILTAWQYDFRTVILFTLSTTVLEFLFLDPSTYLGAGDVPARVNIVIIRSFLFLLIGYIVSSLVAEQRQQRQELAQANRKLIRYATALEQLTISRERNRLSRELHDTLAHTLSGLAVQLEAIYTVWDGMPPRARAMLERALASTRAGLDETRRAMQALRAGPLEDLGLPLAIRNLAEGAAARAGLSLRLDLPERVDNLTPEVEQTYYRVAQEALENAALHAGARQVTVSLRQVDGQLVLEVSDDGAGFVEEHVVTQGRLGLQGMRERAELIGGVLQVESGAGQGTTVRLSSEGGTR